MIEDKIYKNYPKAIANNWKLGELHNEWNEILLNYKKINIKAPRDHLKTFFFFEARALQLCSFYPDIEIRYFTGSDALAIEKLNNVKKFAKLPPFEKLLRGADIDNKTEIRFGNDSRIYVQGYMSKMRGGHPDYIILDDVVDVQVIYSDEQNKKAKERLVSEILPMAEPHTQIVIIGTMQREDDIYSVDLGEDSISKTYDAIVDEEKKITLFPQKWSWKELMKKKKEITSVFGEKWFLKEYRNLPINLLGEIIKPEWIKYYSELPKDLTIYSGWDLSVGKDIDQGDYTAGITVGVDRQQNIYIINVFRDRIDFPIRLRKIVELAKVYRPQVIKIEENVFQADTVQMLKRNTALNIKGIKTTKNKIEKFTFELAPLFENGKVFLKKDDPMQEIFRQELLSLPRGSHDDMADAFCLAIEGLPFKVNVEDIAFFI